MRTQLVRTTLFIAALALALPLTALAQQAAPKPAAPKAAVPKAAAPKAAAPKAATGATPAAAAAAGAPGEPGEQSACPACPEPPPAPTTGTVTITVTPADAAVTLNGASQRAGTEISAKPGTHNLQATKAGYEPWKQSFQLKAGGNYQFAAELQKTAPPPKKPTLTFNMKLGDDAATVTIDGKAITAKKGEAVEVEPGEHEIKISQKGMKDWTEKVTLANGQAQTLGTFESEAEDDALGPYVTIGLGVGLAALGLVFSSEESDNGGADGTSAGPANNTDEDRATAAIVLYTVGGALVATGITLIALNAASGDEAGAGGDTAVIAPYATGDQAGLAGIFTF